MIPHPWGIAGLLFNAGATIGLLRFTGKPDEGAEQFPPETAAALRAMLPAAQRSYTIEIRGFRLALAALLLGFLLQLLDLLMS